MAGGGGPRSGPAGLVRPRREGLVTAGLAGVKSLDGFQNRAAVRYRGQFGCHEGTCGEDGMWAGGAAGRG